MTDRQYQTLVRIVAESIIRQRKERGEKSETLQTNTTQRAS